MLARGCTVHSTLGNLGVRVVEVQGLGFGGLRVNGLVAFCCGCVQELPGHTSAIVIDFRSDLLKQRSQTLPKKLS